jgi:hypothetical protein
MQRLGMTKTILKNKNKVGGLCSYFKATVIKTVWYWIGYTNPWNRVKSQK